MANVVEALSISSSLTVPRAFLCSSSSSPCLSRCKKKLAFTSSSTKEMRIQGVASAFLKPNVKSRLGMRKTVCEASQDTVSKVQDVNDQSFKSMVLESPVPVLVDFWAPWCGPCRMIEPLIDELAKQYSGKIKCVKVNTDESPTIATEYGIRSIPTVMIFKDGEKKDTVIGAVPKTTLCTCIEKFIEW